MDEAQRAEFGRRVREARVARGWNQVQLAEAAHVAPNTVGSIELGKRTPQPQSIAAVMAALGLEPTDEVTGLVEVPADVDLVARIVTMWLMGIPEGNARAAAVLDLVQFLGSPAPQPGAELAPGEAEDPGTDPPRRVRGRGVRAITPKRSNADRRADVGPTP